MLEIQGFIGKPSAETDVSKFADDADPLRSPSAPMYDAVVKADKNYWKQSFESVKLRV